MTVAVLVADGFEQLEVTRPMRALERAGAEARVISLRPGRIRGMNFIWRGRKLPVDDTVAEAEPEQYSALLLPGGFVNPDLLRQSERALDFVRRMDQLGRPIAVICHGPEVLISAGVVNGRRLTSWPGIADDVRNAGGSWEDSEVVRDANWVSSRSPTDLPAFERAMVELFAEQAPRGLAVPPRRVRWVAQAMRVGMLAAGVAAAEGVRRAAARRQVVPRRRAVAALPPARVVTGALHDLSLAAAFGGMLFGKVALDPAARALVRRDDHSRMEAAPWRAFIATSGLSLATAAVTWVAGQRGRALREARPLARAKDVLLAAGLATGAVNAAAGFRLSHANGVRTASGTRPAPEARRLARAERAGLWSGYLSLAALAGAIAIGAALGRRGRR